MGRTQRYEREPWTLGRGLNVANLSTFGMPVVNDIAGFLDDSYMYLTQPESRTWGNAAMSAAGLLPFVPSAGATIAARNAPVADDALDMSSQARMQRADDMGFEYDVYHGSTQDISEFDLSYANPESDMGRGIYTTNTAEDAGSNYAGMQSQDLTGKIERRAEQLEGEGVFENYDDALEAAKKELYGGADNVLPLKGRAGKPVLVVQV